MVGELDAAIAERDLASQVALWISWGRSANDRTR
jgi:hypothetical protein